MEVTNKNFFQVLPLIKAAIDRADFVSIDGEFTGLYPQDGERLIDMDTSQQRYKKCRYNVSKFGMIQYGLSTFRYVESKKTYKSATFCFYLLGNQGSMFSYDPSSMNFLAEHDFDFNKLFKVGLPYLSLMDEAALIEEQSKAESAIAGPSPLKVRDEVSKKFLKEATNRVASFMKDSEEKSLIFPGSKMNGFHRKILYNNIASSFSNILVHSVSGHNRDIEIIKFNTSQELEDYKKERREEKLRNKVGFTDVIRYILDKDKPIIGHNMLLDLLHTFQKFIQPLPELLSDFKTSFLANFPTVYDTKLLAKDPPFCVDILNSALNNLYDSLRELYNPPMFEVEEDCESYELDSDTNSHDAGYDAFITGVCFITMVKKLDGDHWSKHPVTRSKHLANYANKVNVMNSYDIPYINISGSEVLSYRDHVYEVRCPSDWTQLNVRSLFSKLIMKITWANSNLLYVIPQETDDVEKAVSNLPEIQASCPPNVHVKMYTSPDPVITTIEVSRVPTRKRNSHENKRKNSTNGQQGSPTCSARELKRLKSVGSDKLSQLTLESPTEEALKLPGVVTAQTASTTPKKDDLFPESNDW